MKYFRRPIMVLPLAVVCACADDTPEEPVDSADANTVLTDAVKEPLDAAAEAEALLEDRKSRLDDALAEQEGDKDDDSD